MKQDFLTATPTSLPLFSPPKPRSERKTIYVATFGFDARDVSWKGHTIEVGDYELFTMFIRHLMTGNDHSKPMTKEQALDFFFGI